MNRNKFNSVTDIKQRDFIVTDRTAPRVIKALQQINRGAATGEVVHVLMSDAKNGFAHVQKESGIIIKVPFNISGYCVVFRGKKIGIV